MDFNRIRVSRKIWGAIVLLLAAMLVITWFTLWRAVATQQAASQAVRGQYATIVRIAEWKALVSASVTRTVAAASSADREVEKILKADQERAAAQLGLLYAQVQQAAVRADDKAQLQKIDGLYKVLEAKTKDVREAQEDGDGSVVQGRVHGHMLPAAKAYLGAIDDYVLLQQAHADETRAQAVSASRSIAVIGTVGAVLVVALGMFVASTLVRTIRQPLRESVALAEAIAQGDLTQRIDATRGDEFGELMRSLQNMNAFLER
ncbi:HAMP domain-containing protein, partial [Ramlibacter sp. H39-3-26]|uniref:MCP four helix bundle domain-containing protein n=1 Tax=Curvibacter soli TaxID=3031331 RepID=UPI0023DA375B